MQHPWPWALKLVLGFAGVMLCIGAAQAEPASRSDCHQVESDRFVFHSDPWINLHHFLFQWARNVPQRQTGDRRRPVDVTEAAELEGLTQEERQSWVGAVNFYRDQMIEHTLTFDQKLIALKGKLVAIACSAASRDGDSELQAVLEKAMPVYRKHWWPKHGAGNTAWISAQLVQLKLYETILAKRLAEAYGGEWPSKRIRVDVVAYANWTGAYTTNHPDLVTVETSYTGLEALEILFHEVSHASFFEQRILGQVAAAFSPYGVDPPDRLSHAILFATPAELLRSLLTGEEQNSFQSIAERVNERGSFKDKYRIVLKYWKPFLDGNTERTEALNRIVEKFEVGITNEQRERIISLIRRANEFYATLNTHEVENIPDFLVKEHRNASPPERQKIIDSARKGSESVRLTQWEVVELYFLGNVAKVVLDLRGQTRESSSRWVKSSELETQYWEYEDNQWFLYPLQLDWDEDEAIKMPVLSTDSN